MNDDKTPDNGGYGIVFAGSENITIDIKTPAVHVLEYWDGSEGAMVRVVGRSDGTTTREVLK